MAAKGKFQLCFDQKETLRCTFCGGSECQKCGLNAYKRLQSPAISLLHSHWITDEIVAMQRPNEKSLLDGAALDMKNKRITAVFNLTEPGEHPYCGCGVLPASGFPYLPETLMSEGIKHFNFSWQDMTIPSLSVMTDIVFIACRELQNGGKIAVHCHAGFGRTGLTIACILMMKESIEADSVITFVRNRRPGSIQTAAQSEFIHRFQRHLRLMRLIFPTIEEVEDKTAFNPIAVSSSKNRRRSVVCNYKSIAESVQDQQYILSSTDLAHGRYRYLDKLVYYTTQSIIRLAYENYAYACLAITGLTKLSAKSNVDLSLHRRQQDDSHFAAKADYSPTSGRLTQQLRKRSSFMVASNSLSESTEQSMLNTVKLELNDNKWATLLSYTEILAGDLKSSNEVMLPFDRVELQSQGSKASLDMISQSFRMKKGISNLTSSGRNLSHQSSTKNGINNISNYDNSLSPQGSFKAMLKTGDFPRQLSPKNLDIDAPIQENSASISPLEAHSNDKVDNKEGKSSKVIIGGITLPSIAIGRGNSTSFKRQSSSSPSGRQLPAVASSAKIGNSSKVEKNTPSSPTSLSGKRANSLRMNSETDYVKSKKMAANLIAQLLLDWLETRSDSLFNSDVIEQLVECWSQHGQLRSNLSHSKSNVKVGEEKVAVESNGVIQPDVKQRQQGNHEQDDSGSQAPVDMFNTAIVADYPPELIKNVNSIISSKLDRHKLELLDALVVMYRYLRRAGLDWSAVQLAKLQQEATLKDGSDTQALDALVGLRLAIACMHARKRYPGLIRQRGLVMDIVKVFLLKSTNSEYVVINNITFSDETFQQIKNNIGVGLLLHIDVVFRTLNLLVDTYWSTQNDSYRQSIQGSVIRWREATSSDTGAESSVAVEKDK